MQDVVSFPSGQVCYLYENTVEAVWQLCKDRDVVLITDENVFNHYPELFSGKTHIVLSAGEDNKSLDTIQTLLEHLIDTEATRHTLLVGIGGGVITDITGFVASVYMRGVAFGFVPTTLLGMVDAAIGGKNGVNIGLHKNMAGTVRQPEFILYDYHFLNTLPEWEWSNGFAEIIKYACLFDTELFTELEQRHIAYYQQHPKALASMIKVCVDWKNSTVLQDEQDHGQRKLLNFGHTAAHAIENLYEISHGKAVAIGMVIAATLSEKISLLDPAITEKIKKLIRQYHLPTTYPMDINKVMELIKMDKKRNNQNIEYILLEQIGKATISPLSFDILEKAISSCTPQ